MDKDPTDPMRNALLDVSHWLTPAQAAAEHARKQSESKRLWGMVLLSGVISAILGAAVGSWEAFGLVWIVLGVMLTSFACDKKEGHES